MATKSTKATKKPAAKKPAKQKAAAAPSRPKTKVTISKRPSFFKRIGRGTGKKVTAASLYTWNKWLAVLYAVQGAVILLFSNTETVPLTTSYLTSDPLKSGEGGSVLVGATQQIGDINLAYAVAAFLFIAAIAHTIAATVYLRRYEEGLQRGVSKVRWIGYAFSASVMIVTVALLVGVYDLSSLVMLFVLTALMSLLGLAGQIYNQKATQPSWLALSLSGLAGIVPWAVFSIYLIGGALSGSTVAAFVYVIFATIFLFFIGFAIITYLQQKGIGKWKDFLYGERGFMILSFAAKTALAWQVFAGILRP